MSIKQESPYAIARRRIGVRVTRAAANLPQGAQAALFTVSGGRIVLTSIVGEVTTVIQNQLNNTKLVANPTVGNDVDLCAVANIQNDAVGTLYAITGTLADAMTKAASGALAHQGGWIIVAAGAIELNCAAANTGQIKWTLHYVPLDEGAVVTAA